EPDRVQRPKRLRLRAPERTGVRSVAFRFQVIAVRILRQRAVGGRARKSNRVYGHLHPGPNKKPQPTKGRGLPSGFDHGGARGPASSPVGASRGAVLTVPLPGPSFFNVTGQRLRASLSLGSPTGPTHRVPRPRPPAPRRPGRCTRRP